MSFDLFIWTKRILRKIAMHSFALLYKFRVWDTYNEEIIGMVNYFKSDLIF